MTILAAVLLSILLANPPAPPIEAGDYQLVQVGSVFSSPLYVTAPEGDSRLFVVERGGPIKIVKNNATLTTPFLNISTLLPPSPGSEQGLLGLAFHPSYSSNGRFFVAYTNSVGSLVVAEYHSLPASDVAGPNQVKEVITIAQPFTNHNGGMLLFGPDGLLYVGVGDGGGAGDPNGNGQNKDTLLGTILRLDINSDGFPGDASRNYSIPASNPFVGVAGADEIWFFGLRNPWRFSLDPDTGRFYIADVGQSSREEVTILEADSGGANLGWDLLEGTLCHPAGSSCSSAGTVLPQVEYPRAEGHAVTGGPVYRGERMPELDGTYFYGDFSFGWFRSLLYDGQVTDHYTWSNKLPGTTLISSFGIDGLGEMYIVSLGGKVWRLEGRASARLVGDFSGDGRGEFLERRGGHLLVAVSNGTTAGDFSLWTTGSHGVGWSQILVGDFNADGSSDVAEFHPANGTWWVNVSTGSSFTTSKWADFATNSGWGAQLVGDFDGDGRSDIANYFPGNGTWWVSKSTGSSFTTSKWADFATNSGWLKHIVGDFNGDGRDDIASFHPANGTWWVSTSTGIGFTTKLWADFTTATGWVSQTVGDYDGDALDDLAQFHPGNGTWWVSRSAGESFTTSLWADFTTASGWGPQVVGDYDGDGKDDISNFHSSNGTWWISQSTGTGFTTKLWADFTTATGWTSQLVGDYDGDGRDDIVNYHGGNGTWWVSRSTGSGFATSKWAE